VARGRIGGVAGPTDRRTYLRAAGTLAGAVASGALSGCLGGTRGDGGERYLVVAGFTASWARVESPSPDAPPRLRFDAAPVDEEVRADGPGAFVLELANLAESPLHLEPVPSPPFGVVYAVVGRVGGTATAAPGSESGAPSPRFLLWRDYAAEGCEAVVDAGRTVTGCDPPTSPLALGAGETVTRRYELRWETDGLEPGRYVAAGEIPYRGVDEAAYDASLAWRIQFALRERVE